MPAMMFVGNLVYVAIAVVGGLLVASGRHAARRRAGVHPVLPAVHPAAHAARVDGEPAAVRASPPPSACSSCSTPTSSRPIRPHAAVPDRRRRAGSRSSTCRSATTPDKPLIEDLSLVAEPGQTVAIVGPTGAGKTTLVNLMMRFYELDGGRITLDGVDIAADDAGATCASRMGMVLQDTWLFGGTIRDNIAYGRPGRDRGGDPGRGAGHLRRPVRALAARRLRHACSTTRAATSRRARSSCSRSRGRSWPAERADPGRGDQLGRHPHRAAGAAGDERAARRPHQLRDRAPALDHPRRRPHPGDGVTAASSSRAPTSELLAAEGAYARLYNGAVRRADRGLTVGAVAWAAHVAPAVRPRL